MHTILIYLEAADQKTEGPFGDASKINDFKATLREIIEVVFGSRQSNPAAAREEMTSACLRLLTAFSSEAKSRTNNAIRAENRKNGAARGPKGSSEPPTPTASAVDLAYASQRDDINDQLAARISAFLSSRKTTSP